MLAFAEIIVIASIYFVSRLANKAVGIISLAIVLLGVLQYGRALMYVNFCHTSKISILDIFTPYKNINRLSKHIGVFFIKSVITIFSATFLIFPAIVKHYSYSQIQFIRGTYPDISIIRCFYMSKRVMRGHRWELFMLDLSFLGWLFLVPLTGVFILFYLLPYYHITMANYYLYVRDEDRIRITIFARFAFHIAYCLRRMV